MDVDAGSIEIAEDASDSAERPFRPSWINRLIWWIDRSPGPSWAWYLLACAILVPASNAQAWVAGVQPVGEFTVAMSYYGLLPVALLASIAYLDQVARRAASNFRPALDLSDEEFDAFRDRLTVVPARPVMVLTVAVPMLTAVSYAADPVGSQTASLPTFALVIRLVAESIVGILFLVLAYHTLRQLREVDRIHRTAPRVDLLRPRPLYAFAGLTTRTAIVLLALLGSSIPADPKTWIEGNPLTTVPWIVFIWAVATAAFVAPLWGMHTRIAAEKAAMQDACGERLSRARDAFHAAVDAADATRVEVHNKILGALITERDWLARLPTWPWQPGQVGAVVSAIVLPVVLFLVTRLIGSAIGS